MDNGERWVEPEPANKGWWEEGPTDTPLPPNHSHLDLLVGLDLFEPSDNTRRAKGMEEFIKRVTNRISRLDLNAPRNKTFQELRNRMFEVYMRNLPRGAIRIDVRREGTGPCVPYPGEVTLHYAIYFEGETTPFETTVSMGNGEPLHFRLGSGKFLPALEVALTLVRGPTANFMVLLEPEAMVSQDGRTINKPALFVMSVFTVQERNPYMYPCTPLNDGATRFSFVKEPLEELRINNKQLMDHGAYCDALVGFKYILHVLANCYAESEDQFNDFIAAKVKCYYFTAICYCRMSDPRKTLRTCQILDTLIDIEALPRMMYFCGRAYHTLGKGDVAIRHYLKVADIKPCNAGVAEQIMEFNKRKRVLNTDPFHNFASLLPRVCGANASLNRKVHRICTRLDPKEDYTTRYLPVGEYSDEDVLYIKLIASLYRNLAVYVEGTGNQRLVSIVKFA